MHTLMHRGFDTDHRFGLVYMTNIFPSKLRDPHSFFPSVNSTHHKILKLETNVSPSSITSIFERQSFLNSQRFNYSPNFNCNFASISKRKAEVVTRFVSFTNIKE